LHGTRTILYKTFFQSKVEQAFFNIRFNKANIVFHKKMEKLIKEFNELNDTDAGYLLDERVGTTVVLVLRQEQYRLFEDMRK